MRMQAAEYKQAVSIRLSLGHQWVGAFGYAPG